MKPLTPSPDPGLRIVWWNTGLAPGATDEEPTNTLIDAAAHVLDHLLNEVGADLIVLGEMCHSTLAALRTACPRAREQCDWLPAFEKAGRSGFSICVLGMRHRLSVWAGASIVLKHDARHRRVGLHFRVQVEGGGGAFDLIASHWPSRLHLGRFDSERTHIAAHLRRWMSDHLHGLAQRNVVLVGDFNEEPFDEGVERYLLSSRDSGKVRRRKDLLYNPFWRHLSSFRPKGDSPGHGDPGTHFYPKAPHSDWHTFDQLMVSSPLVSGRSGWRLNEDNTRVVQLPLLPDGASIPSRCFDHLPIVGHLERSSQ